MYRKIFKNKGTAGGVRGMHEITRNNRQTSTAGKSTSKKNYVFISWGYSRRLCVCYTVNKTL